MSFDIDMYRSGGNLKKIFSRYVSGTEFSTHETSTYAHTRMHIRARMLKRTRACTRTHMNEDEHRNSQELREN